jgi:hypothetical protein
MLHRSQYHSIKYTADRNVTIRGGVETRTFLWRCFIAVIQYTVICNTIIILNTIVLSIDIAIIWTMLQRGSVFTSTCAKILNQSSEGGCRINCVFAICLCMHEHK